MASMIHLAVGRLEIDWGKNQGFQDHSALFQGEWDVTNVPYYYARVEDGTDFEGSEKWKLLVEYKEGLSKPLSLVIDRLNLLGHTYEQCEKEFAFLARLNGFDDKRFTFTALREVLTVVDVASISAHYGEGGEDFGKFFRRELAPRLRLDRLLQNDRMTLHAVSEAMENLSAYTVLHLLALNPSAASLPVQWAFNDIDTGGYARREDFVRSLDPGARFLIVTEGSSDAAILRHSLKLLRPHLADFFDFVDMEEGYPFSGTGNVFRFVQGLISIAVQNKVLVLFDNDAEGLANRSRCTALNVPANMRILSLPDLPAFTTFPTVGPGGESVSDINGRAAAIECYLDLDEEARVRWTSYNQAIGAYQGELDGKTRYMRAFLHQRQRERGYDYSRLEQVLDVLARSAVSISEPEVSSEWQRAFNDTLD
ncbi:MAG: HEPN/Toprim-associated domain-containing protein [Rhodovibrionaceae bacterium]